MVERVWSITKATLGIGGLIVCALLAAQKLDRERATHASRLAEPAATGSIRPGGWAPLAPEGPAR